MVQIKINQITRFTQQNITIQEIYSQLIIIRQFGTAFSNNNNIFMNKFYKTSYPKTSSINQILKNKKEIKRQTFRKEDLLNNHLQNYKQTLTQDVKQKNKFHIDNKIQIDSDLLFNKHQAHRKNQQSQRSSDFKMTGTFSLQKNEHRRTVLQNIDKRKQQNKTQSGFYQPSRQGDDPFIGRNRPQSKQQTRTRILSSHSNRRNEFQRPQTSKGSRKSVTHERLLSVEDQREIDITISKNRVGRKEGTQREDSKAGERMKKKYNFQTSIDDQFLSLFAN